MDRTTLRSGLPPALRGGAAGAAAIEGTSISPGRGGNLPRSITIGRGSLTGERKQRHMQHRREGRRWCSIGLGQISNGTGAAALVYLSSNTATKGTAVAGVNLLSARLCLVNDGGTATYLSDLSIDGRPLYTGTKLSVASALVGKASGVIDTLDKDAGMPIGDITQNFDLAVYMDNGDTVEVFVNCYSSAAAADVIDNDDDAPDGE